MRNPIPPNDVRRQHRGFDFDNYYAHYDEQVQKLAVERERSIKAAERILGREIVAVPVGQFAQQVPTASLETEDMAAKQQPEATVTHISEYEQTRTASRAA